MRCYICNREDDVITYDKIHKEYGPCVVCQAAIEEVLMDYHTKEAQECDTTS